MTIVEGILLGLVQGVTEFLPVSSSGHLALMRAVFGSPVLKDYPLLFDVAVHAATILAVIIYFRREVLGVLGGFLVICLSFSKKYRPRPGSQAAADRLLFVYVIIASVPTAIISVLLKDYVEKQLQNPVPVGLMLLITGIILYLTHRHRDPGREIKQMNPIDAALIGIIQGIAVIPGISRSGSTIGCGIMMGLDRKLAARFSFLIAVPAVLGACILKLPELFNKSAAGLVTPTLIGAAVAFVTGFVALVLLMQVLERRRLAYFAPYCWFVGLVAIIIGLVRGG